MIFRKTSLTVTEFFFRQTETFLIDTRGATEYDPAIPGSKSIYILDLMENIENFQKKYDAVMMEKVTLLVCSKGDGTEMLRKQFPRKYQVMSLQGGMVAYLEFITRLLAEHPYEKPHTRDETMRLLLEKLTDRHTPFPIFRRIANRLLSSSPNPALRQKG